jgi:hypothetical protein
VTLQFVEPVHAEAGRRVFDVAIQGAPALSGLDLAALAGRCRASERVVQGVRVTDGSLRIDFAPRAGSPCVAGIVVRGMSDRGTPLLRKINCGGPAQGDYEADPDAGTDAGPDEAVARRGMPVGDFYADFARALFGPGAAGPVGRLLARIDGAAMPEPSRWIKGPGGVKADERPWHEAREAYAFVNDLAALRADVRGAGALARFDLLLDAYRAMAALAEAGCSRGRLDASMREIAIENDPARKRALASEALDLRLRLARAWERAISLQVAATATPGELGTLANLEQHSRAFLKFLEAHDEALAAALGEPLPPHASPAAVYRGPARIIVPTVRSQADPGERLTLKVILLAPDDDPSRPPPSGTLFWRALGQGEFDAIPLRHVNRRVFEVQFPPFPADAEAVEYYLQASFGPDARLWPPTAPALNQTVVLCRLGPAWTRGRDVSAAATRRDGLHSIL